MEVENADGGSAIQHQIRIHWSVGGPQVRDTAHGSDEGAQGAEIPITESIPKIFCKVYEDNSGALEIATVFKLCPRTKKHLNTRFHHFRQYQERGEIEILPINTTMQVSNILTKPLELA